MKNLKFCVKFLFTLGVMFINSNLFSQNADFHIYLCFGQSNMEGSATIEEQDKTVDSRFKMMASMNCPDLGRIKGKWYAAEPPLSQCGVGLSPADYFGRTMIDKLPKNIKVGVVSVAIGGCDIRLFDKDLYMDYDEMYGDWFTDKIKAYGGNPYQRLIELAKLAQKDGVVKGIILHQGETNEGNGEWPLYVKKVYENILADLSLNAEDVPLLAGEVAHAEQNGKCASMNTIIDKLPEAISTAYVVSSKGCGVREDNVHFNSAGVRELGKRYAEKMIELEGDTVSSPKLDSKTMVSPEVLSDKKVAFRIYAPNAHHVTLKSDDKWDKINLEKRDNGVWEGFWFNVEPGAYRYRFMVDGVPVFESKNPSNKETVPVFMMTSGKEFFAMKDDIPHGAISQRYYFSETIGKTRRMHVWTPAGYEKLKNKLPVLYLIHGGGDVDNAWATVGCAGNILDNLLAEGKIEPMLVVMPNGSIDQETETMLNKVPIFKEDLMTDIIPFIESAYNVHTNAKHRAIMGLSFGGLETLEVAVDHHDMFEYIVALSSGWWISKDWEAKRGKGWMDDKKQRIDQMNKIAKDFNTSVKLMYFTQGGPEDIAYKNGMETMKIFKEAGIKFNYSERPGGHTWKVWRQDLRDIAPLLFK